MISDTKLSKLVDKLERLIGDEKKEMDIFQKSKKAGRSGMNRNAPILNTRSLKAFLPHFNDSLP